MNDDSCSCLLFLTPIDVLQKSLYPESLPSFSRLGCGGLRFPFWGWGLKDLGMAWRLLESVSVCWLGLQVGSQRSLMARISSTMRMMAAPRKMKRSPRLNTTFLSFPY